jgi:hypothetical protein
MRTIFRYMFVIFIILLSYGEMFSWGSYVGTNDWVDMLMTPDGVNLIKTDDKNSKKLLIYYISEPVKDTSVELPYSFSLLCISIDSKLLAIRTDSNFVSIINLETLKIQNVINGVVFVDYSYPNSYFINNNTELIIYFKETGLRNKIELITGKVTTDTVKKFISISDNAEYSLAQKSADSLELWDFKNLKFIKNIELDTGLNYNSCVTISNDGKQIAYFDTTHSVKLYDTENNNFIDIKEFANSELVQLNFNKDNSNLIIIPYEIVATARADTLYNYNRYSKKIFGYKIQFKTEIRPFTSHFFYDPYSYFRFSSDGSKVTYLSYSVCGNIDEMGSEFNYINILNLANNKILRNLNDGHPRGFLSICNNDFLVTSSNFTYIWDAKTGKVLKLLGVEGVPIFAPDNQYLFLANDSIFLKIDLKTFEIVDSFKIVTGSIYELLSSEANSVILCKTYNDLFIINYPEMKIIKQLHTKFDLVKFDSNSNNFIAVIGNKIQIYSTEGNLLQEVVFDSLIQNHWVISDVSSDFKFAVIQVYPSDDKWGYFNSSTGYIWDISSRTTKFIVGEIIDDNLQFTQDNQYYYYQTRSFNYKRIEFFCKLIDNSIIYQKDIGSVLTKYRSNATAFFSNCNFFIQYWSCSHFSLNNLFDFLTNDVDYFLNDYSLTNPYVFPNPASDRVIIPLQSEFTDTSQPQISIYNILGNKIDFEYELADGKFVIDCTKALAGMYYYVIKGDSFAQSGTFVVSR